LGFGIREMIDNETIANCNGDIVDRNNVTINYLDKLKFKQNFSIRTFSSGCYFYDKTINYWKSDGLQVLDDIGGFDYIHCQSDHLTEFAGGFLAIPPAINYEFVWNNGSFKKNPIIYATVIALTTLYILLAITIRFFDVKDSKKIGVCYLKDNLYENHYLYEIIILTGNGKKCSTDSKVSIDIIGTNKTGQRLLEDQDRKAFRSNGIDSFILANEK
jgi:hypothetical protein